MSDTILNIKDEGDAAIATPRSPIPGRWYEGWSERGTGAIAKYQGYGSFTLGDGGDEVNMSIYDYLIEKPPRTA